MGELRDGFLWLAGGVLGGCGVVWEWSGRDRMATCGNDNDNDNINDDTKLMAIDLSTMLTLWLSIVVLRDGSLR